MSSVSVDIKIDNQTPAGEAQPSPLDSLYADIQFHKDRKSECYGHIQELEAMREELYKTIGATKKALHDIGVSIGDAKANLSVDREKMYTLEQAKRAKEAKDEFGAKVEKGYELVDSLYAERDNLREEIDRLYSELNGVKDEIAYAYDDFEVLKAEVDKAYARFYKAKPAPPPPQPKPKREVYVKAVDHEPQKRRCYGKPPGGTRKCRTGH